MNLIRCRIAIIITILLTTKESCSDILAPDKKEMNSRFAHLLNSLVKVNKERVDTLKDLLKLYDVKGIKPFLRSTEDEKKYLQPDESIGFDSQDYYHELINKLTALFRGNKRLCFSQDTESNSEETFHGDFKEQDLTRGIGYTYRKPQFHNNEHSNEADQIILLHINSKQQPHERDDSTSLVSPPQDELYPEPLNTGKSYSRKRICIRPKDAYVDCRYTCHDTYTIVCAKYGCMPDLRKHFRKECKHACKHIFKEPYYYD